MSGADEISSESNILIQLENAIITSTFVSREDKIFTGCVYDSEGRLVSASQRTKENVIWVPKDPELIDVKDDLTEVQGKCIYLGHITSHYGHFLLETLSRFWALLIEEDIYDKYIFQPFVHSIPDIDSFSPAKVCFECFGIDQKRVLIVQQPYKIKHLYVPSSPLTINNEASVEMAIIYKHIVKFCKKKNNSGSILLRKLALFKHIGVKRDSRIYLSRKRQKNRYVNNEEEVEGIFASLGFVIIYPELLSFEKQVNIYRQADIVAGFNGSAMHNSVFMKKGALAITIGDIRYKTNLNVNQLICNNFSGVKSKFIMYKEEINDSTNIELDYLRSELELLLESHL